MAFMPEPQTLLIVVVGTDVRQSGGETACRAGAWPRPACSTQPISDSLTSPPGNTAVAEAGRAAMAESSGAETGLKAP